MEECFAMKYVECRALEGKCPGAINCPFFRTRADVDESQRRAYERIARKPEYVQIGISVKYYGGQMPWQNDPGDAGV